MSVTVRQWDVVRVRINPNDRDEHPAVVLTCDEFCTDDRRLLLNVLYGTTRLFLERLGLDTLDQLPPLGDFVPGADVVEALEHGLRPDG